MRRAPVTIYRAVVVAWCARIAAGARLSDAAVERLAFGRLYDCGGGDLLNGLTRRAALRLPARSADDDAAGTGGDALATCQANCSRTRGCAALGLDGDVCEHWGGDGDRRAPPPPVACVSAFRGSVAPESRTVRSRGVIASTVAALFPAGRAYRFFSVLDGAVLLARDGRFPNASPGERLVAWPAGAFGRGEPVEVALGADAAAPVPAHNFAVISRRGATFLYGGRARSRASGVAVFRAAEGLAFGAGAPRVNGTHVGCAELRRSVDRCEWDGKLSAAEIPGAGGAVALYGRLNTRTSRRWVQVAVAPHPTAPFGRFEAIRIAGFDGCRLRRASVYFAAVSPHPFDETLLVALLPLNEGPGACAISLAASRDGRTFGPPVALVASACEDEGRVRDFPADGWVVGDHAASFFVHRDMPTDALVLGRDMPPSARLVRHDLSRDWLRAFARGQTAALARAPPEIPPTTGGVKEDALPACVRKRPPYFTPPAASMSAHATLRPRSKSGGPSIASPAERPVGPESLPWNVTIEALAKAGARRASRRRRRLPSESIAPSASRFRVSSSTRTSSASTETMVDASTPRRTTRTGKTTNLPGTWGATHLNDCFFSAFSDVRARRISRFASVSLARPYARTRKMTHAITPDTRNATRHAWSASMPCMESTWLSTNGKSQPSDTIRTSAMPNHRCPLVSGARGPDAGRCTLDSIAPFGRCFFLR